jgi:hypothetical protein
MTIEKLLEEIRMLSPADRYRLRIILEADKISEEDIEASKYSAGGWSDIDAEKMIEDIYRSRDDNSRRVGVNW